MSRRRITRLSVALLILGTWPIVLLGCEKSELEKTLDSNDQKLKELREIMDSNKKKLDEMEDILKPKGET